MVHRQEESVKVFQKDRARGWLAAAGILMAACGGDNPVAPGRDPEIINNVDNFQYQITDIQDFTGTQVYSWENSGTTATVDQSASIASGSVTLVLRDANGVQVYSRSLADNGTFSSTAGTPGTWTVRVVYNSADATVNFRVDKAN
jgi:hypothetical protein